MEITRCAAVRRAKNKKGEMNPDETLVHHEDTPGIHGDPIWSAPSGYAHISVQSGGTINGSYDYTVRFSVDEIIKCLVALHPDDLKGGIAGMSPDKLGEVIALMTQRLVALSMPKQAKSPTPVPR